MLSPIYSGTLYRVKHGFTPRWRVVGSVRKMDTKGKFVTKTGRRIDILNHWFNHKFSASIVPGSSNVSAFCARHVFTSKCFQHIPFIFFPTILLRRLPVDSDLGIALMFYLRSVSKKYPIDYSTFHGHIPRISRTCRRFSYFEFSCFY